MHVTEQSNSSSRHAHAGQDTRVGDVRPLLVQLGISIDIEHDEKRLYDLDRSEIDCFEFRGDIEAPARLGMPSMFEAVTGTTIDAFRDELATAGILDDTVTEQAVDRRPSSICSRTRSPSTVKTKVFCWRTRNRPPTSTDRYPGRVLSRSRRRLDASRRLVARGSTRDQEFERNIRQFQLFLQNGVDQYYLVQDTAGGTPVTPCLYFEELLDEEFDRFSDL